jgi:hypothetical protein
MHIVIRVKGNKQWSSDCMSAFHRYYTSIFRAEVGSIRKWMVYIGLGGGRGNVDGQSQPCDEGR